MDEAVRSGKDCNCRGDADRFFADIRDHLGEFLATIPVEDRVNDCTYKARLDACGTCDGLWMGTTCRHCGCIVGMRAMRANKACPHPVGDRWTIKAEQSA